MKVKFFKVCFFLFFSFYILGVKPVKEENDVLHWINVDFDSSMVLHSTRYTWAYRRIKNVDLTNLFKEMFNKNNLSVKKVKPEKTVPKIMYQIWLGKKLPSKYHKLIETWVEKHPDWTYVLWVDNPQNYDRGEIIVEFSWDRLKKYLENNTGKSKRFVVDVRGFDLYNHKFFNESKNYGEKADILRYEVLYNLGGLYIDTDFECLKSFDILNENYNFYCGIGPLDTYLSVKNGLIGSIPGHPILKYCIENMRSDIGIPDVPGVATRTGPKHLTKSFFAGVNKLKNQEAFNHIIALPPTYFYPFDLRICGFTDEKIRSSLKNYPEAFAIHYWDETWGRGKDKI